jgi:hypothetical protein
MLFQLKPCNVRQKPKSLEVFSPAMSKPLFGNTNEIICLVTWTRTAYFLCLSPFMIIHASQDEESHGAPLMLRQNKVQKVSLVKYRLTVTYLRLHQICSLKL